MSITLSPVVKSNMAARVVADMQIACGGDRERDKAGIVALAKFFDRLIRGASQHSLKVRHNAELVGSLFPPHRQGAHAFETKNGFNLVRNVALAANSFLPFNTYFENLNVHEHYDRFPRLPDSAVALEIEKLFQNLPSEELEMMYKNLAALISNSGDSNETADYLLQAMPPDLANYARSYGLLGNLETWNKIPNIYGWNAYAGTRDEELFPFLHKEQVA